METWYDIIRRIASEAEALRWIRHRFHEDSDMHREIMAKVAELEGEDDG